MIRALAIVVATTLGVVASAGAQDLNNPWADGGYTGVPLPEIEGAVPWDKLAEVELVFDDNDLVPDFSDDIRALDGQTIKMVGFVVPLDSSGTRQLLSLNSPHCPFCLPSGPEGFVELNCDEPIEFTVDPVVVSGKFEIIKGEWLGYYYRMAEVAVLDE